MISISHPLPLPFRPENSGYCPAWSEAGVGTAVPMPAHPQRMWGWGGVRIRAGRCLEPKKHWWELVLDSQWKGGGWLSCVSLFLPFMTCEPKQLKYAFYFTHPALLCPFTSAPAPVRQNGGHFTATVYLQSDWTDGVCPRIPTGLRPLLGGSLTPKNKCWWAGLRLLPPRIPEQVTSFPPLWSEHS